ncbi:hypothetical protein [Ornithinimicrobium kibberense]|uniref:hypothetical protein n=1 Tax=Ornithinimicrobium kibberense TaxID=282060 RepID=UPI00360E3531
MPAPAPRGSPARPAVSPVGTAIATRARANVVGPLRAAAVRSASISASRCTSPSARSARIRAGTASCSTVNSSRSRSCRWVRWACSWESTAPSWSSSSRSTAALLSTIRSCRPGRQ